MLLSDYLIAHVMYAITMIIVCCVLVWLNRNNANSCPPHNDNDISCRYAATIVAHKFKTNNNIRVEYGLFFIYSANYDEALGHAYLQAYEKWPSEDNWILFNPIIMPIK